MVFLPIVERELRVAARRKSTRRIRVWTTLAGLLVSFFFFIPRVLFGAITPNVGQALFTILTYYVFGLSLLAGVLLAADCISEEKREGTLGLLFLTDLRGYDVVLGKLMAVGLNAFYGLVAVLPVLGLPLLIGGVTGGEYWKVSLGLVNTLFYALATGILVSVCSREAARAMGVTFCILTLATVGLQIFAKVLSLTSLSANPWYFTSISPFSPVLLGSSAMLNNHAEQYWISLAGSHFFAWFLLLLASWALPRVWQDKAVRHHRATSGGDRASVTISGKPGWGNAGRARLLDANPILWLAGEKTGVPWWAPFLSMATLSLIVCILSMDRVAWGPMVASPLLQVLGFALKIFVAFQASRFFVEARRSGVLELILSTPLTRRQIIQGQWLALKRKFIWPALAFIVASFLTAVFQFSASNHFFNKVLVSANTPFGMFFASLLREFFQFFPLWYPIIRWIMDVAAISWMGMWLGLTARKPNLAAAMTILFVVILPSAALCIPNVLIDLVFILFARGRLYYAGSWRLNNYGERMR